MTQQNISSHFTLSVVAVILSCLTGFVTIPLALAALIFSLRVQDLVQKNRLKEAKNLSTWACVFGWVTVGIALIPIILMILFGGAILAFLATLLATA